MTRSDINRLRKGILVRFTIPNARIVDRGKALLWAEGGVPIDLRTPSWWDTPPRPSEHNIQITPYCEPRYGDHAPLILRFHVDHYSVRVGHRDRGVPAHPFRIEFSVLAEEALNFVPTVQAWALGDLAYGPWPHPIALWHPAFRDTFNPGYLWSYHAWNAMESWQAVHLPRHLRYRPRHALPMFAPSEYGRPKVEILPVSPIEA